jgi:hypothetical protein
VLLALTVLHGARRHEDPQVRQEAEAGFAHGIGVLGACPRNSGFWWRSGVESDSACL